MAKLAMKTDKALVEERAPETSTNVPEENLAGVKRLWMRPLRRFMGRSTKEVR